MLAFSNNPELNEVLNEFESPADTIVYIDFFLEDLLKSNIKIDAMNRDVVSNILILRRLLEVLNVVQENNQAPQNKGENGAV